MDCRLIRFQRILLEHPTGQKTRLLRGKHLLEHRLGKRLISLKLYPRDNSLLTFLDGKLYHHAPRLSFCLAGYLNRRIALVQVMTPERLLVHLHLYFIVNVSLFQEDFRQKVPTADLAVPYHLDALHRRTLLYREL